MTELFTNELKDKILSHKRGTIGIAQINPIAGNIEYNAKKVVKYINLAQSIKSDLVVFPELTLMGYPIEDTIDRYPIIVEDNIKWLKEIAKITTKTAAIIGFVEPRKDNNVGKKYYNSIAVIQNGSIKSIVRKSLLPTYCEFNDYRYFEPSPVVGCQSADTLCNFDESKIENCLKTIIINGIKYGISICEDCWNNKEFFNDNVLYSKDPVEELSKENPDVLINCSASPTRAKKEQLKHNMLSFISKKYKTPFVYVNQVGAIDNSSFDGSSRVFNKEGKLIARAKSFEEQFLVYTAFTIAEEYLVVTYPLADFEGKSQRPSIIVHRLKKILPNVKEESEGFKLVDDKYEKISAKLPTLNELMIAIRKNYDGAEIEDYWKYVYDWYLREPKWKERIEYVRKGLEYTNLENNISKEKAKKLYEDNKNKISLSVSRLERYAQCPFAYYIQYGLKAKDRKIYEFTAPDLGSFMHEILDEFTNEIKEKDLKWSDLSKENCRNIINSLVDNQVKNNKSSILNSSKRYSYFTDRFKRILTKSVMVISEQMKRSDFEIYKNELAFGFSKDVNSIKLDLPSGESFYLNGRIDRVDKLNLDGETYLRIIDYKTGSKKFDLNKFYNGLQMQLLVYLDALINNSENIVENQAMPGAILYFRIDDPILKSKGDLTEEEIKSEVLKELKLEGLLLDDVKVVKAMDNTLEPGTHSLIIPANMKKAGDLGKNKALITMEQFELLRKYVNEKMIEICQNMIEGKIDIEPCKENKNIVCDYCNYSHICQFDSSLEDNRYKVIPKKKDEDIWKSINEKVGGEVNGD